MATVELSACEARRWTRIGVLSALAMLLGYAETFVPIPIPGVKLGLANIAVLVALAEGDIAGALCVCVIKVLATGLLFGSPLTMAYSAAGTLLAFLAMAPLSKLRSMHVVMLSIVGALCHEIGQVAVASLLLGTTVVWYTTPLLLVAGCAAGALCGVLANRLYRSLSQSPNKNAEATEELARVVVLDLDTSSADSTSAWLFALLVACVVVVFHLYDLIPLLLCAGAAGMLCLATHVEPKTLARTLRPLAAIGVLTLVFQLVLTPETALVETTRAMLRLASIASLCAAFMKTVPASNLTVTAYKLVAPLRRLGIPADGFVLAFDVALRLVPTLGDMLEPGAFSLREIDQIVPRIYTQLEREAFDNK